jgi:hypothetical protein
MRVTLTVYRIGIVAIGRVRLRARSCARARLLRGCSSVVSRRIRLIPERGAYAYASILLAIRSG